MRSLELSTTQNNSAQFSWKIHALLRPQDFGDFAAKSTKSNVASLHLCWVQFRRC
jgi:hypothetical protein